MEIAKLFQFFKKSRKQAFFPSTHAQNWPMYEIAFHSLFMAS